MKKGYDDIKQRLGDLSVGTNGFSPLCDNGGKVYVSNSNGDFNIVKGGRITDGFHAPTAQYRLDRMLGDDYRVEHCKKDGEVNLIFRVFWGKSTDL